MEAQLKESSEQLEQIDTPDTSAVMIAVYETHDEAERAIRELVETGVDMHKLSIVGKDYQLSEQVVGQTSQHERT